MTARIIALAAALPRGLRARPWPAFLLTLAFAYGVGMWMQVMHAVEGGYERNEPPLLLHWLRDSTLSLPLVFTFVWLGLVATRHLVERRGQAQCGPGLAVLTCAAVSAIAVSLATAIGVPLHAGLFSAHHGGHDLPFAEHMARDGLRRARRQPPHLPARHERPRAPHPVGGPRAPHVAPPGVALRPRRPPGGARPRPRRPRRDLRATSVQPATAAPDASATRAPTTPP